ncbi:unnamed protein product [Clavelina lepadiformis]|uniref:Uncharacterized protein n=1 Tax=Clavelina lepadiformis TaxID=159417 RepID=A0ABP0FU11_CLALP
MCAWSEGQERYPRTEGESRRARSPWTERSELGRDTCEGNSFLQIGRRGNISLCFKFNIGRVIS